MVATNLENSGNLKNYQNLGEISGKFEFLWKNLENSGQIQICHLNIDENKLEYLTMSES